jgi:hypothetical protein
LNDETMQRLEGTVERSPTQLAVEDRLLGSLLGWSLGEACALRFGGEHLPTAGEVEVVLGDPAPLTPASATAAAAVRASRLLEDPKVPATFGESDLSSVVVPADAVPNALAARGDVELLERVTSSVPSTRPWPGGAMRFVEIAVCRLATASEPDSDVAGQVRFAASSLPPGALRDTVEGAVASGSAQQRPRTLARELVVEDPTSTVAYGLIAFLGAPTSFERAMRNAVRLPVEHPGAAAVTGALVGATVGARELPATLLGRLVGYRDLLPLGRRLLAVNGDPRDPRRSSRADRRA